MSVLEDRSQHTIFNFTPHQRGFLMKSSLMKEGELIQQCNHFKKSDFFIGNVN